MRNSWACFIHGIFHFNRANRRNENEHLPGVVQLWVLMSSHMSRTQQRLKVTKMKTFEIASTWSRHKTVIRFKIPTMASEVGKRRNWGKKWARRPDFYHLLTQLIKLLTADEPLFACLGLFICSTRYFSPLVSTSFAGCWFFQRNQHVTAKRSFNFFNSSKNNEIPFEL